jgi:hypothetical protein
VRTGVSSSRSSKRVTTYIYIPVIFIFSFKFCMYSVSHAYSGSAEPSRGISEIVGGGTIGMAIGAVVSSSMVKELLFVCVSLVCRPLIVICSPLAKDKGQVPSPELAYRLPEVLGVSFNITGRTQHEIVDMNHLLTAKTIWGDVSWPDVARGDALDQLQQY